MRRPQDTDLSLPPGYTPLRALSSLRTVYLCREHATGRLLVMKMFEKALEQCRDREAKTLHHLATYAHAPNLYFAVNHQEQALLAYEFINGSPLAELRGDELSSLEKKQLVQACKDALNLLHTQFQIHHGDISPKNVVVLRKAHAWQISFLDWEFAQPLHKMHIDNYNNYQGTIGFTEIGSHESLEERDRQALNNTLAHMKLGQFFAEPKQVQTKERRRWLPWI